MADASRCLFAFADPREGRSLVERGLRCLATGVGKAAAAAGLAAELAGGGIELVVWVGVAGAYPGGPAVLDGCVVGESVFADEGAMTERGFLDLPALGLAPPTSPPHDRAIALRVAAALDLAIVRAATISTCSGRDDLAVEFASRTGAAIETMESAAAALACARAGVPLCEVRCISNRTGDRARAGWRIKEAAELAQALALDALERGLLMPGEAAS